MKSRCCLTSGQRRKLDLKTPLAVALPGESAPGHTWPTAVGLSSCTPREAGPGTPRRQSLAERIEDYADWFGKVWEAADSGTPGLGPVIGLDEQARRERLADESIEEIERRLRQYPANKSGREAWRADFLHTAQVMARDCLGFPEAGLKLFFNPTALNATRQFIRDARAFDPVMSDESVFQALRNLWVIHNLQLFLQSEIALSPAGFGYSMLYPCTDNYLDDPKIPESTKVAFGVWLDGRLAGTRHEAPDAHAEQVSRLVGLIEKCFVREDYPEVYLSLQAIHEAQMASLRQQSLDEVAHGHDLLAITLRKGGASVLADAYLVRGRLSEAEARFLFGYGVLLQLMDDLQDLRHDLANRHQTIFTRQTVNGPLDELTSRLWSFAQTVLWSSGSFASPQFNPLKNLIQENCKLMLLQSVARHCDHYTGEFADAMQSYSPFRFAYLQGREETVGSEFARLAAFLRREHGIHSLLETLD